MVRLLRRSSGADLRGSRVMADLNALFGLPEKADALHDCPSVSFTWALLFQQLGGVLGIDQDGRRYTIHPEPCVFRMRGEELPCLPDPEPHERFLNGDEFRGALKLVAGLLRRVSDADKDLVYGMLAAVTVDERKFVPTIDEPRRVKS